MCGRFTLKTPAPVLIEHFDLGRLAQRELPFAEPRYNIAPTQEIAAVRAVDDAGEREVALLRWGLVPAWSKDPERGPPLINARAETVAEKPSFRAAFKRRRCLIIADGFYEWQKPREGKGQKQPYYIHRPDNGPFAFAGLWEVWSGGRESAGPRLESCTIVTTSANDALGELHDRMPVIPAPSDYQLWLDPTVEDADQLRPLLAPCPADELIAEPVSTHVNRVANDDPRCIAVQKSLFD